MAEPEVKTNSQGAAPDQVNTQGAGGQNLPPKDTGVNKPVVEDKSGNGDEIVPKVEDKAKTAEAIAAEKAAKEAETNKVEEKKDDVKTDEADWTKTYVKMPDPAGQAVVNLLEAAKVTPVEANAIFEEALTTGDLTKVKWDVLEAKLGKDQAALAKAGIEQYYANQSAQTEGTVKIAHDVMEGPENWATVSTWAKTKEKTDTAFAKQLNSIRKGIDTGETVAELSIKELRRLYEADPKNSGLSKSKIVAGNTVVDTSDEPPLSRADYMKLRHEAEDKRLPQSTIAKLQARRRAGMAAGI